MTRFHLDGLAVVGALLVAAPSLAAGLPGQGAWETTLQARDLDHDGHADAFYDTDLNITWLQDANYPATIGFNSDNKLGQFHPDGRMPSNQVREFAKSLNFSGITGWRLPALGPLSTQTCYSPSQGYVPCGPYQSELGHLFEVTLGNLGLYDPVTGRARDGVNGIDYGWVNTGPFKNVGGNPDTPYLLTGTIVGYPTWFFDGDTRLFTSSAEFVLGWAVHDGDVSAVPEPSSVALLLGGLGVLGLCRQRRSAEGGALRRDGQRDSPQ